jgi:hypothetical protein
MHGLRSNAEAVARRDEVERSPISLRLTRPALAVICGRPCVARSTMDNWRVRMQWPLSSMSINRSLGHLVECPFLWAIFREYFAIVGHILPILFVTTYYKVYFMHYFIFISLYCLMEG